MGDVILYRSFSEWSKRIYKSVQIKCPHSIEPFNCTFTGNAFAVDDHQIYECPYCMIRCPNSRCEFIDRANKLESNHFMQCEHLTIYCDKCLLPKMVRKPNEHNCMSELITALRGNIFYIDHFSF